MKVTMDSPNDPKRLFGGVQVKLAWLILAVSTIHRLYLFTLRPPLWLDEAMLALNIRSRSFWELLAPLEYDQGAPIGFLWMEKLATLLIGQNEISLRFIPFLAGVLSLPLLVRLAFTMNATAGRIFAIAAVAISYPVISYSLQAKQYSLDMLIALLIYLAAGKYFLEGVNPTNYQPLAWLGALAPWLSHPAVFSLSGLGSVLLWQVFKSGDRVGRRYLLLSLLAWVVSFGVLFFVQYGALAGNNNLTTYWAEYFMPLTSQAPVWIYERLAELARMPGGISQKVPYWLVVGMFIIGLTTMLWRKDRWATLFAISSLTCLTTSAFGMYPFGGRLALFLIPGIFICMGASLDLLVQYSPKFQNYRLGLAFLLGAYLLGGSLWTTIENSIEPKKTEDIRETMGYLVANYEKGDAIYVYHFSAPVFDFYAEEYSLQQAELVRGSDPEVDRRQVEKELYGLDGKKRVWYLFSHLVDETYLEEERSILELANAMGFKKKTFHQPGTAISLYLYDLSNP